MEDFSLAQPAPPKDPDEISPELRKLLAALPEGQLMRARHEIDILVEIDINQMNLTEELGLQYRQAKQLLANVQNDDRTPANQKVQIFNSLQNQLDKIIKQRQAVLSQERLKRFEAAFLNTLKQLGDETLQQNFLDLYGEFLRDKGK